MKGQQVPHVPSVVSPAGDEETLCEVPFLCLVNIGSSFRAMGHVYCRCTPSERSGQQFIEQLLRFFNGNGSVGMSYLICEAYQLKMFNETKATAPYSIAPMSAILTSYDHILQICAPALLLCIEIPRSPLVWVCQPVCTMEPTMTGPEWVVIVGRRMSCMED